MNAKTVGRLVQVSAGYDEAAGTLELRFPHGAAARPSSWNHTVCLN